MGGLLKIRHYNLLNFLETSCNPSRLQSNSALEPNAEPPLEMCSTFESKEFQWSLNIVGMCSSVMGRRLSTLAKSSSSVASKAIRQEAPKHAGGRPKGIHTKHRNLVSSLSLGAKYLRRNTKDKTESAAYFSSPKWLEELAVKRFVKAFMVKATLGFVQCMVSPSPPNLSVRA